LEKIAILAFMDKRTGPQLERACEGLGDPARRLR
jgi:hypothetical protein